MGVIRKLLCLFVVLLTTSAEAEERIISLAPHITELLFSVGAGSEVVGVMSYSNYPEAAKSIPVIGTHDKLNYEQIITLQPTLAVGWQCGNSSDAMDRLRDLGIRVESHDPHTLEDVGESLRWTGEISGHDQEGEAAAQGYFKRLEELRETHLSQSGLSVYYQIWHEPQMTVNGNHLISDVIQICGGNNIFSDVIPLVPKVSMESILQRNPEVIVMAGAPGEQPERMERWQRWTTLEAIQKDNLFEIHPDLLHRHSARILDGAEALCSALDIARARAERD
jgi:iron complex transport system substrate-binding protein